MSGRFEGVGERKSLTKPFAATVILQLVDEGKVSLDDPVSKYGINLQAQGTILVRHLLSHTSGLPSMTVDPEEYAEFLNVLNGRANPSDTGKPSKESVERFHAETFARRSVDVIG